jgi:mannose-6-phosphate isomerase-like protein (cupin superfamily)
MLTNLKEAADKLPSAWKSLAVATTSNVNIKVLRMDERTYEAEAHEYAEALIVLDGCMNLSIFGETVAVRSGEMYLVPAGVQHGVAAGSQGTLLILDPYLHT